MKKISLLVAILAICNNIIFSQEVVQSPRVTVKGKDVEISYGQPSKRGREIFGELEPYGKVWRTGANEATEITFARNAFFGGKPVKAGTYTLFTIPDKTKWTFILNSELKQWGAYKYEEIKGKNVLSVTVPAKTNNPVVEKLTISLPPGKLVLEWDKTKVEVPIKLR